MTQAEINAFLAIVKTGNISKAANSLYITQPALSRRLKTLETELGYPLILRQRGIRNIDLTEEGKNFVELAERWVALWGEMQDLSAKKHNPIFRLSSLDSVGTYLFLPVYQDFLYANPQILLELVSLNSYPAYDQMEAGLLDLAFIMDQRFSKDVMTLPAFSESMRLICSQDYSLPPNIHPSDLNPEHEIFIAWSIEYEKWHRSWFCEVSHPYISIDKMSHLEYFIQNMKSWAIVPSSVAVVLNQKLSVHVCELTEAPPNRIINYLSIPGNKNELLDSFFNCLRKYIQSMAVFGIDVLF